MLDETEYAAIERLHHAYQPSIEAADRLRVTSEVAEVEWRRLIAERDQRAMDLFREMAGVAPKEPFTVLHHRRSLYGAPCPQCGKPFRSPRSAFCAACGWRPGAHS
jgi:hypothetical protein